MTQMSVDELASHLSEAIQQVRGGETVQVTSNGEVVALLVRPPAAVDATTDNQVPQVPDIEERKAALAQLDAIRAEMGKYITEPTDVTQLLSEMRSRLD